MVSALLQRRRTFTPRSLSGLQAWYAADRIPGLASGAAIGTWADLSGYGRDATQGTAGAKPTFTANSVNGKPVALLDGGDHMTVADFAYGAAGLTAFAVVGPCAAANQYFLGHYDFGNNQRSWYMGSLATTGVFDVVLSADGTTTTRKVYQGGTDLRSAGYRILSIIWNAGTLALYVNGVAETLVKVVDDAMTAIHNSTAALSLGSLLNNGAAATQWSGNIAEIVLYDRALTLDQHRRVAKYLGAKFALAVS